MKIEILLFIKERQMEKKNNEIQKLKLNQNLQIKWQQLPNNFTFAGCREIPM